MDGLGLVYEKQGNTGAGAYNNPVFQIGNNPLDHIAAQIKQENDIAKRDEALAKAAKDKANNDALKFDYSGWDIDNKAYFTQAVGALQQKGSELKDAGKDLNDYSDPDVREWQKQRLAVEKSAVASKDQGSKYDDLIKEISTKRDKYDYEASVAGLNNYMNMSPVERLYANPNDALVLKKAPFDKYAPIKDLDLNKSGFIGKTSYEDPSSSSSSTFLDKAKLKKHIENITSNPINDEHYQEGLKNGEWKNKEEYAKVQFEEAELHFAKEAARKIFPPKTNNDKNGDGIDDQQPAGGQFGAQYPLTYDYKTGKMKPTLGQNSPA